MKTPRQTPRAIARSQAGHPAAGRIALASLGVVVVLVLVLIRIIGGT